MRRLALALLVVTALTGCEDSQDKAVAACESKDGIPIYSAWSGYMKRCDFPPVRPAQ